MENELSSLLSKKIFISKHFNPVKEKREDTPYWISIDSKMAEEKLWDCPNYCLDMIYVKVISVF